MKDKTRKDLGSLGRAEVARDATVMERPERPVNWGAGRAGFIYLMVSLGARSAPYLACGRQG